jgi:molybdate transport system substrate-binding protein
LSVGFVSGSSVVQTTYSVTDFREDTLRVVSVAVLATVGLIGVLTQGVAAIAAEIKVKAGAATTGVLSELRPQFERATGHKAVIEFGLSDTFKRQIETGEAFDIAIIAPALLDDLIKQGKIVADTRADFARVGIGVAVRAGAPKPDISSVDAFKRAMLSAKSITYPPEGATGIHLVKMFERLGIAEQMKAKTKPQQAAERVPQAVAEGEAELGILGATVLLGVAGVEFVGLIPPELQDYVVQTAGVGSASKAPDAARAFVKFLMTPESTAVITAKGMERVTP